MKKIALVTGGARGIGFGISKSLAKEGYDLSICGTKDAGQAGDAIEALKELGAEVLYCKCDVSDKDARARMLEDIKARFGRLDLLVNNAGIAPKERKDILDADEESFELLLRTNLQGPYFLTQSVARWMIAQKEAEADFAGVIVNVSSFRRRWPR
jgi:NAD(P)-dependent dehydrogenase (short-subunit alcohol dehydrogenase family)